MRKHYAISQRTMSCICFLVIVVLGTLDGGVNLPFDVVVLSLDIVHRKVHGDLTRWRSVKHIIALARQGRFAGGQAGPLL